MLNSNLALCLSGDDRYLASILAVVPYSTVKEKIKVLEYQDMFDTSCQVVAILYCSELKCFVYCDITDELEEKYPTIQRLCSKNFLKKVNKRLKTKKVTISYSDKEVPLLYTDILKIL